MPSSNHEPPNGTRRDSSLLRRSDPYRLVLLAIVAVNLVLVCVPLAGYDLILNYPFYGGDSPDWIANGLFLAGEDVRYSARPPLLPILIAALFRSDALSLLPLLLQVLVHLTAVGAYSLLRRDRGGAVALLLSLAWLLNATWQRLSLEIMADVPATCLLALGLCWLRVRQPPRSYIAAGLLFGSSALFQPTALLVAPAALAALIAHRRDDLRSRSFWIGAALLIGPTMLWTLVKRELTGTAGDVFYRHWSLLGFHADSLGYYLLAYASMIGLPAAILAAAGLIALARGAARDAWASFVTILFGLIAVFFVVFYGHRSQRFLVYLLPLSYLFVAEILRRIRAPSLRLGSAAAVLLWSLVPFPGRGYAPDRVVVWPVPPVYAVAPAGFVTGSQEAQINQVRLRRLPLSELLKAAGYFRLYRQPRVAAAMPSLSVENLRDARSAVYFYAAPITAGQRATVIAERGNLLRKQVKFVPFSVFAKSWSGFRLEPVGSLVADAVYRVRIPGREETWLAVTPRGGKGDLRLRDLVRSGAAGDGIRDDASKAARIAAEVGDRRPVMFAPPGGLRRWQLCLAFLVETTEIFAIEPSRRAGSRAMLGPSLGRRRSGDVELVEHEVFGWPFVVIEDAVSDVRGDRGHGARP